MDISSLQIAWEEEPVHFVFNEYVPGQRKMHVKRLHLRDWVRIDKNYQAHMKARKEILTSHFADVFLSNTSEYVQSCKWELFELLVNHLPERFPDIFELREDYIFNKVLKESVSTKKTDEEDPLLRMAKLTEEDWIILEWNTDQQEYVLTAGILCFPLRWSFKEKFNKPLHIIHQPVKEYLDHLSNKVSKMFADLKPEFPIWRSNWGVLNDIDGLFDLFAPPPGKNMVTTYRGKETGRKLFLRNEYQTLRKLPRTKCIVFSIKTYQRYLEQFQDFPQDYTENFIKAIEDLDKEMAVYKGAPLWKDATVKYLQGVLEEKKRKFNNFSYLKLGFMAAILLVGFSLVKK